MSVPKLMRDKYEEIAPLISEFCREQLSDDYETLCLRLLEKLCRKRPSPLSGGRTNTWAAGIIYAIASNNYIFDRSQPIHKTAEELSSPFGLAKSTVANKTAEIARLWGSATTMPNGCCLRSWIPPLWSGLLKSTAT